MAPVDVRVRLRDGRWVAVSCRLDGRQADGLWRWTVLWPVGLGPGDFGGEARVGMLPAGCAIAVPVEEASGGGV